MTADADPRPSAVATRLTVASAAPDRVTLPVRALAAGREDFPVLGMAAPPGPGRAAVQAFYRAARRLDDIADDRNLLKADRHAAIAAFMDGLEKAGQPQLTATPAADELRRLAAEAAAAFAQAGIDITPLRDLAEASRRDVDGFVPADWAALDGHCRLSAAPVARVLMAVSGDQDPARRQAGDDLAVALQVLNHIRDLGADYRTAGRVWLPGSWLADAGLGAAVLGAPAAPPRLLAAIGRMLEAVDELLDRARPLLATPVRRLRIQAALTLGIARRHRRRFTGADPLARRIRPRRRDWAGALADAGLAALRVPVPESQTAGSSFGMAIRLMPSDGRPAMQALYAVSRLVDDIADGHAPAARRRQLLEAIDADLLALGADHAPTGPDAALLNDAVRHHHLPIDALRQIVAGCLSDCSDHPGGAPGWADLLRYADRVAGAVGEAALVAFGVPQAAGRAYARHLGRALQLTNILRDIDEDAIHGRIYLPAEALMAAGADPRAAPVVIAEGQARLPAARALGRAARDAFAAADAALPDDPHLRRRLRPAMAMADAYRGLLAVLEARRFAALPPDLRRQLKRRAVRAALRHAVLARIGG